MIPVTTAKDREQLKKHALELLKKDSYDNYEGLVILINELQDTNFKLSKKILRLKDTWLVDAACHGHLSIVKYMVSLGASIDSYDNIAVRWACRNGHLEIVKYLVSQGADVHAQGGSALRLAVNQKQHSIVKYLREQGVEDSMLKNIPPVDTNPLT